MSGTVEFRRQTTVSKAQDPYGIEELYDGHTVIWLEEDTGITESEGKVSKWVDIANGYELIPYASDGSTATIDNYPSWSSGNGVTFDGTDDVLKYMVSGWTSFGTVYAVVKQNSWSADDVLFSYAGLGSVRVSQKGTTPEIVGTKSSGSTPGISGLTLGSIGILIMHNDPNTPLQTVSLNGGTAVESSSAFIGYASAGVILGAVHSTAPAFQRYANVTIYAIIYRDQIDSGATLTAIYDYLSTKY